MTDKEKARNGGYVLRAGAYYYVGKMFTLRGEKHPGMTAMVQRAHVYTTRAHAIKAQNALTENTGIIFSPERASEQGM